MNSCLSCKDAYLCETKTYPDMFLNTPLIIVDTQEKLVELADQLSKAPVIGVDTESDSFHHYQEKVCLIQFSDLENDFILDPLQVDDMSPLAPIFANPDIVKVLHGADYDVVCLRRDFGFVFKNLFDTNDLIANGRARKSGSVEPH